MAKDFRADRIRTRAIIGSGSISPTKPNLGLLIYSSSIASNYAGGTIGLDMTNVGDDVWMLISGSASGDGTYKSDQRLPGGSVLFTGDVVVSGTLWAERSIIEVDGTVEGDLRVPNKLIQGGITNLRTGKALVLADPFTPNTGDPNNPGSISFKTIAGSSGVYAFPTTTMQDVFFHVSGSRNAKDTNVRGLSLFDGDVHLSGNLSTATVTTASFGGDVAISGSLRLGGDDIYDSGENLVISFDGNGNLDEVGPIIDTDGLIVSSSSGNGAIRGIGKNRAGVLSLGAMRDSGVQAEQTIGQIKFGGNEANNFNNDGLHEGARIEVRALEVFGPSNFGMDMGFFVRNPGSGLPTVKRLQIIEEKTVVTGNLYLHNIAGEVAEPTIFDHTAQPVLTLSGSGNATFNNNLTVVGDLNVSGSVTSIATDNLKIKDQVILMASGASGPNVKGGIAIFSGSSFSTPGDPKHSLFFGAGAFTNSWRVSRVNVKDGKLSTGTGDIADTTTGEPVRIELAGLRFPVDNNNAARSLLLTASLGGGFYHITASNNHGSILLDAQRAVRLKSNNHVFIDGGQRLYLNETGNEKYVLGAPDGETPITFYNQGHQFVFMSADGDGDELMFASGGGGSPTVYGPNRIISFPSDTSATTKAKFHISGSGEMIINNRAAAPGAGVPMALTTVISASSDETRGGPVIILSSSGEYGGGSSREGFITIGDSASAVDSLFTISRHRDVRTLLSGTVGTRNSNTRGVTLVAGDLVVSGNTRFVGATDIGSISTDNLTLDSVASGEPYVRFRSSDTQIRRNTSAHLEFTDTQVPGNTRTLTQLASNAVTNNADVFEVTHQTGVAPYLSYVASTASFSFDHNPTVDGYAARRTNQVGSDVYFFVSGSIGSSDYSLRAGNGQRGTAVFGGDIHVSGSLYADVPTFWTSLHTAYSTPDTPGLKQFSDLSAGAGAVIDTSNSGIPLQLRNPALASAPGVNDNFGPVLSLTGSLDFSHSGGTNNPRIRMQTNHSFQFHNADGEVFRLVAGNSPTPGTNTHARFIGNNQLRFNQDTMYVRGVQSGTGKNRLFLQSNQATNGEVHLVAGEEAAPGIVALSGSVHVSGSLVPNQSSTYNLGSPDQTWANVYTGDLHLNNDRGSWTIYEEPDMLVVVNNLTGKKYKMGLTPLEDDE